MHDRRGIALIIVLAIVAILSVLVLEFSYSVWVDMYLSANYDSRTQALSAAKAGIEYGIYLLRRDDDRRVDSLGDEWAKPLELTIGELAPPPDPDADDDDYWEPPRWREDRGLVEPRDGGMAKVLIVDEERKIGLNMLNYKGKIPHPLFVGMLEQLIEDLNVPDASFNAAEIVEAMVDWVDADEDGSCEYIYETLPDPYKPMNRPFDTVHELRLVTEVSDTLLYGTVPYPDIEPGYDAGDAADWWEYGSALDPDDSYGLINFVHAQSAQQINVNTAPREVLTALFDGNTLVADEIMERRRDEPFTNWGEFKAAIGSIISDDAQLGQIGGSAAFKSKFFTITSIGEYRGVKVKVTAIVYRSPRFDVTVQYYRTENVE